MLSFGTTSREDEEGDERGGVEAIGRIRGMKLPELQSLRSQVPSSFGTGRSFAPFVGIFFKIRAKQLKIQAAVPNPTL